jgi:hypothetical protein
MDGSTRYGLRARYMQQEEQAAAAPESRGAKRPLDERTIVFGLYDVLRSVDVSVGRSVSEIKRGIEISTKAACSVPMVQEHAHGTE